MNDEDETHDLTLRLHGKELVLATDKIRYAVSIAKQQSKDLSAQEVQFLKDREGDTKNADLVRREFELKLEAQALRLRLVWALFPFLPIAALTIIYLALSGYKEIGAFAALGSFCTLLLGTILALLNRKSK